VWEGYGVNDIIPVTYDSSDGLFTFRILNTSSAYLLNYDTSYMLVTVNPEDGSATVVGNETLDYGDLGSYDVTGEGFVGTCNGKINLILDYSEYTDFEFSLVKVAD